jgi:multidrug efflux pump
LATAVVFGLGIATVLTLAFTPAMLALRVWLGAGAYRTRAGLAAMVLGKGSAEARDLALDRMARRLTPGELVWDEAAQLSPAVTATGPVPLRAAE